MTKLMTWRDEWSIGIATLDADHRALIETLMDICLRFCPESGAGTAASGPGQAGGLVDALEGMGEQVREHFRREEAFMRAIGYERLGEHVREHAVLMAELKDMLRDWRERDIRVFDDSTHEAMRQWLLTHILETDRSFADAYFRICGIDPESNAGGG